MKKIKQLLGERIRSLRIRSGLSQEALAERAKLHRTYIGSVERGEKNCTITGVAKIAAALRVNVSELISFPEPGKDIDKLRKAALTDLGTASPEAIKLVSDLLKALTPKPRPKRKKK